MSAGCSRSRIGRKRSSGLDFDAAANLIREIAAGVGAAGFRKLVLFNTHPDSEPLMATAAADIRAESGLNTYVVDACALGVLPGAPAGIDGAGANLAAAIRELCEA